MAEYAKQSDTRYSVYVLDDDQAVCDSLRFLLESAGHPVIAYTRADQLIREVLPDSRGCLVIDLRLPGTTGIAVFQQLKDMGVTLPTIMITGHGDVPIAVRAIKDGFLDFLEKPFSDQRLLDLVSEALTVDAQQRGYHEQVDEVRRKYDSLTPRERQVMEAVVNGKLNKQIAVDLGLSPKTIEVHRAHVMEKMGTKSLAEVVRMSVLLEPETVG
jgi:FixJ family two-component response regulator